MKAGYKSFILDISFFFFQSWVSLLKGGFFYKLYIICLKMGPKIIQILIPDLKVSSKSGFGDMAS